MNQFPIVKKDGYYPLPEIWKGRDVGNYPIIKNGIYAGVGSRETPVEICRIMYRWGYCLSKLNLTLRSGGAIGADISFEQGCDKNLGNKEIYYTYKYFVNYKNTITNHYLYNDELRERKEELVYKYHPRASSLSKGAFGLMMRNCHQILGCDLMSPVDFVLMWSPKIYTRDNRIYNCSGGTGFAVRLAYSLDIPIFDITKLKI